MQVSGIAPAACPSSFGRYAEFPVPAQSKDSISLGESEAVPGIIGGVILQEPECPELPPTEELAVKLAVENTCELCRKYTSPSSLELHRVSRRMYREMVRDPSTRILVVCHLCHCHIHRLPVRVKDQRAIVSRRSFFVRWDLRKILGYREPAYIAPDDTDLSQVRPF